MRRARGLKSSEELVAGATPFEAVDLLDHDLFAHHEPWEVFDRLQREAPVFFHTEPQGRGFWALTKYADVLAVLKDPKTFSSELGGAATIEDLPDDVLAARRNFLEFDPPKHGKYRRLLAADFTPKAVGRYEEWLRDIVRHRLESAFARNEFDLVHELAAPIPIRVLGHILGLPEEELPRLVLLGDRLIADTEPELVGDLAYRGEQPEDRYKPFGSPWAEELCSLGRAHYAKRRECPRDDVLFALLVVAGNETTRQSIALGALALARHPDEFVRLRADRSLIPSAVEELLRFASPVWFFRRTAACDTAVRGTQIAAGEKVVVWFAAANRDPDQYLNPHDLDIGRNPIDHLTFGRGGPHFCLGAHLAKLELRLFLEEFVDRVSSIELTGRPERIRSNFVNGLKRLPVRVTIP
jgi:cytochrome P450